MPVNLLATESHAARTLAVPFFNGLTDQRIEEVCDALE
jgi:dTDP-4-amino-4,6-dideoxygalactose transaminase